MDRQRSIRSFFQKPPPPSSSSPLLSDRPAQPVSAIMRKFLKDDHRKLEGHFDSIGNLEAFKGPERTNGGKLETDPLGSIIPNTGNNMNTTKHIFPDAGFCPNVFGPETRPMQPLVPRLKRIKGDECNSQEKSSFILNEPIKKMRSLHETCSMEKEQKALFPSPVSNLERQSHSSSKGMNFLPKTGSSEKEPRTLTLSPEITGSKFQWLNPSSIRDANGRRPDDPLYDRRSLYIPHEALSKMSASQKQYWEVKRQYMDIVLFFKVGKFYELYELDAEIGQKELDWKMTISGVGKCRQVGISESGIDDAIQKLIARGYKVGRIEQLETSEQAKSRGASSVIQRKLIQVRCPSTTSDDSMGADAIHLLALKEGIWVSGNNHSIYGFAFLDYAELKLWSGFIRDDSSYSALGALLVQISPKEIVYENQGLSKDTLKAIKKYASTGCCSLQLTPTPGLQFLDASEVRKLITTRQYFSGSFESWISTIDRKVDLDLALCALGGLVDHVTRLKLDDVLRNGSLSPYHIFKCGLKMDGQTLVNLEIFYNNIDGSSSGTLYKYLDHCLTPSGKRLLRKWICNPLKSVSDINERLNVVEGILKNPGIIAVISEYLRRIPDLERLLGRIKASVGSEAVLVLPTIGEKLLKQQVKSFGSLIKGLGVGIELLKILYEEASTYSSFFRAQNLPDLCKLDDFLNQFEVAIDDVFPHYQDPDVKDTDAETLSALIEPFVGKMPDWSQVIHALNCIDVLLAFAVTANSSGGSMSRPVFLPVSSHSSEPGQVNRARVLEIKGLRHPYAMAENGGPVVPNDICLGGEISDRCNPRTLLLTGPNMGGKSTLLRATCLSVILAQLGCLVPCDSCVLSLVDVIFTRLGAVDRIMSGESTFFIECAETASILRNATEDSLVLLDELGRGTSTFDGYAIAYAVFRHLIEKVHCRLLFATHYHPLTKEFASHPLVSLQHMACAFRPRTSGSTDGEQELFFLYQLTSGACPESYGLQVALMAGIPSSVVETASRARETMKAMIGNNFKSSEMRSEFSSYHEECVKSLLEVSQVGDCADEDCFDTLLCLWHEVKSLC